MKNFKLALVASFVFASASGIAVAATDGILGLTSTGTSIVTIIKENAVQITNVGDIDLGTHSTLAADEAGSDDVCVFGSTGTYNVTMTSTNGVGGLFALASGADSVPYTVSYTGNGTPAAAPIVSGTKILTNFTSDTGSLNCGGSTNANFGVTVPAVSFNAAAPGTYTDTLTLLVEPQ